MVVCFILGIFLGWLFTNQDIWLKSYETEEPSYLKGIDKNNLEIRYYNLPCLDNYNFVMLFIDFFDDFCTTGLYNSVNNRISIALKNPKDEVKQAVFHEYGHSLWRNRLSFEDKINYERLYFRSKITLYANRTSASEDFSELYSLMMFDFNDTDFSGSHKIFEKDYRKEKFIEKILKENKDYDLRNITPLE